MKKKKPDKRKNGEGMSHNLEFQRRRAVNYIAGRVKPWALIFTLITCAVCFLLSAVSVTPVKYIINEGDIAPATIIAPKDTVDKVTTEELKIKAQKEVRSVYKVDKQSTDDSISNINKYFQSVEQIRAYCEQLFLKSALDSSASTSSFDPGDIKWSKYLTDKVLGDMRSSLDISFTDDEIIVIAAIKKQTLANLRLDITQITETEFTSGIKQDDLNEKILNLKSQITANAAYTENMKKIAVSALSNIIPNMFVDNAATEAAKIKAAENVLPSVYKKGQIIVQVGEVVNEAQVEVLRDLGIKQENTLNYGLYSGVFIYVLLCFIFFAVYTVVYNKELFKSIKYVLLTGVIIIITAGIAIPLDRLEPRIITVYLGTFLACILISPRSAISITALLSFLTGLISASTEGGISERTLITILAGLAGGLTALFFLRKARHRTEYIYSGIAAGLVNTVVFGMVSLIKGNGLAALMEDGMWAMINGAASAVIAIGALPVLESVFRIATATKLLEILNPNQPLLKRLSLETPGTYHHSIITANLAEAAAEDMGLNTLLVKATAYYHDIGKLKKPEMYKENQQGRDNPHDTMDPVKSASVLRDHVIFGKYLSMKYKLPKDITDIIEQHHGTSIMQYFYNKARDRQPDINTGLFRYKGPRPQTKEALLLMMADCTEAAVRANGVTKKEQVRDIIDKLIRDRLEDGQFEECDITQKDLSCIADAFVRVYQGMFHERIQYTGAIQDAEDHNGL
jgi:putative nucleotidyltransferase with HDIG domain